MKKNLHIKIHEITRVEGHGDIVIDIRKGRIKELRLDIIESPRFFEVMLVGRKYDEAQHIMSRICGICAVSHTSASLKAIEAAMGMTISRQSLLLRKLAFCGESIQSHILHLFFLVFPDLLGAGSIAPLLTAEPELARTGLELKRLANEICAVVGGRHIHPISLFPGGVAHTPEEADLKRLKKALLASFAKLDYTLGFLSNIPVPQFAKPRETISLKARGEYPLHDGKPYSDKEGAIEPEEYSRKVKEYCVNHSTAKHARTKSGTFMVGALARLNNNFKLLSPRAKAAAKKAGLTLPLENPFMNNMAQLIECFHLTDEAAGHIDSLIENGLKSEPVKKPRNGFKGGRGIGIVEAPRGTLYHDYTIDKNGIVKKADCVIPTAQNLRSIEDDLKAFVPTLLDRPREEIRRGVETLVRAYDPCISCSTHIMDVRFV
ncbi:MAG: Ni/Fe hydrogenase subunit alpha [Deltaproteobacteria bacterium]|nr:Ni/Fe hydrogenase subunit alpha [Deltaproteobacteria bacterium]